ncbi:hypothetical protein SAFG77S_08123 [Streptomyces afghaniensis]
MKLTLRVWRQKNADAEGAMSTYEVDGISSDMSFLEMLDTLNEELILKGEDPVAFDHDCREGICGACSLVINGDAHGPERTTTCQLHMRSFKDGDTIDIEPWRASAFPVIKDLVVNRSAFDRIIQAGGYITAPTGAAPRGTCHTGAEAGRRLRLRTRRVHRVRRVCRGVPERCGDAVHVRQGQPPERAATGRARARDAGAGHGGADGRGGLRRVHPHGRVRHGVPQGHSAHVHHRHEQGVAAGHAEGEQAVEQGR